MVTERVAAVAAFGVASRLLQHAFHAIPSWRHACASSALLGLGKTSATPKAVTPAMWRVTINQAAELSEIRAPARPSSRIAVEVFRDNLPEWRR